jgi:glycine cleavage system H protein
VITQQEETEMAIRIDPNCRYTETHEWVRLEDDADGDTALCGITDYAQDQLSDIVYVELPEVGDTFDQGEVYAVVESVKAASDCYLPVGGEILEANEELAESPELVNAEPYDAAWFVRIAVESPEQLDELMDAEAYAAFVERLESEEEG